MAAFVKGVDDYQDFLRATVAFPGNDHRLGAQEAPPAVLSIFLGDELEAVVQSIIQGHGVPGGRQADAEDRRGRPARHPPGQHRPEPHLSHGLHRQQFEFRMLGSSQSISGPNITLNTRYLRVEQFADELEASQDFQADLEKLIRRVFTEHQRIIFNGNGYDEAWIAEAEKRGLSNLVSAADALPMYTAPKNMDLFIKHGIYTKEEIEARAEIHIENYSTVICIEARTMADMIRRQILPAVSAFAGDLCDQATAKKEMNVYCQYEASTAYQLGSLTDALMAACDKLEMDLSAVPAEAAAAMRYSHDVLIPDMAEARKAADQLEALTASDRWPFPTYSELLFSV